MNATLLFCAVSVLLILLLWLTYCYAHKETDLPPLAVGALPILGHIWLGAIKKERLYKTALESILTSSFQKGEETVYLSGILWKLYVCADPEDMQLLSNTCLKKDPLYEFFNSLAGGKDGLIGSDVSTWKIHRKLLNPTMNQSVLDTYLAQFNEQSCHLVALLSKEVGKGYFNPLVYLRETVLRVICETLMGVSVAGEETLIYEFAEALGVFSTCFIERMKKFYYCNETLFNWSSLKKKQDAAASIVHNLPAEIIRRKRARMSQQEYNETDTSSRFKSFLDLLLEMDKAGTLTESEVQQEVNTFFAAAFDTTYHALGMMLLTIGSYPEVQQKIVDELQTVFEGSTRDVEKQDMSKLKYLEAVVKETMRLYPVIMGVGRILDKDLKLKRYTLPAGSRCFMSIYHAGRHRSWGADAAQFRPERWLDGSLPRSTAAYAVFGLGKRSCIGSNFAITLMKTVLCHIVRHYRISGDITRVVLAADIVVTPMSGHHVTLEKRIAKI